MPRSQQILTAFNNGEVSTSLTGRVDTDQYPFFCSALENLLVHKHGGVHSRAGLHFVLETKFPQKNSRLIPFVFSQSESYMLEAGDGYLRIFRNSGYLENLNAVKAFIGDGTSTKYLYPHPEVAEADIKVLKNGDEMTVGTGPDQYQIAPADLVNNQVDDYDAVASWDLNYTDEDNPAAASPWVLDGGGTAVSPADSEPILNQIDVNIARGSLVDVTFDVASFTKVADDFQYILLADGSLGEDFSEVVFTTLSGREIGWGHASVSFSVTFQAANPQTSDVVSARLEYGNTTDGWTAVEEFNEIVDNTGSSFARTGVIVTGPFKEGDQFRVVAKQANDLAADIETVATSSIDVAALVDYYAGLNTYVINAQNEGVDSAVPTTLDGLTGTASFAVLDNEVTNNYPLQWRHQTDPGVTVTLENLSIINKRDGWEITFGTAPALSDVVVVLDGSSATPSTRYLQDGESVVEPSLRDASVLADNPDIYEIESPFSEDQLEDLYYVQANDQLFVCHFAHKPWRLTRYNSYDWRWEQPEFKGAPWEDAQYSPALGYPRVVTFFQERLWFASTLDLPQTFWGSRSADFYEFELPAEADPYKPDDPVEYTLASYTQESIEWFSSERILLIGTAATESRLDPDQYIAADRLPKVSKMTSYGGAHQIPIYMGNLTCFVHSSGKQLRSFKQDAASLYEAYSSIDLGWMSEHLFDVPFKQPAYQLLPDVIAVMTRLDGVMLAAKYDPSSASGKNEDLGWSRIITDGWFKSNAVIPDFFTDQIWAIVEREIDDVDNPGEKIKKRNVEFMSHERRLDSYLTYPPERDFVPEDIDDYPPIQNIGNLDHLEGKTVKVIVDGALHPDRVVTNGSITLERASQDIAIGLGYNQRLLCAPFEGGNPAGTAQGQQKRWIQVWARLLASANPIINGKRPPSRTPSTPMDTPEPLRTGQVRSIKVGFDRLGQIEIVQDLPLDLHLVALFGDYEVHAG